ncbi:AAA family ATPase [Tardiphaga sp. 215_C5_N2_1]|uniref:AAA family ATPase n=1 Tax=Tardiphaga sp. 215_C5_N2_1 TaxID=3240774 RepID=UPI003F8BBEE0
MTALSLRFFDDCRSEPAKPWLIKGVMAMDEDSSWFGPAGSLKSTLLTDIAVHLAAGADWRGHRTKGAVGVIYFAFERAALTRRRLAAYAVRDQFEKLPIAVAGDMIDLVDSGSVQTIVETVWAAEARFGIPVGLIIGDTYAKAVAAGGGDEDKAQHANVVAANLKRVHEILANPATAGQPEIAGHAVHIAMIGHTGHDGTRERGSSAKLGHVDLAVKISGVGKVKTAEVTKGNDQPEHALTAFEGEEIVIGQDEDNEPLTAFIVSGRIVRAGKTVKRTQRQELALNALDHALAADGQSPPAGSDVGPWLRVVRVDAWRQEMMRRGVIEADAKNPRSAFKRIKDDLLASDAIVERDGFVWPVQPGGIPMPPPMVLAPSLVPAPPV